MSLSAHAGLPLQRERSGLPRDLVRGLDLAAKTTLLCFLGLVLADPGWGNLEGKAPVARAVLYPLLAFAVPVGWWLRRATASYGGDFPWLADLFVTLTCFTDILGNRLDLYDSVEWFDDWMHLMNTGLLTAARSAGRSSSTSPSSPRRRSGTSPTRTR